MLQAATELLDELEATELIDELELFPDEFEELKLDEELELTAAALDDELVDDAGALELELGFTFTQSVVSLGSGFHPAFALKPAKICARLQKVFAISPSDN